MSEGVSEADRTGALSQAELLGTEMYDLGLPEPLTNVILHIRRVRFLETHTMMHRAILRPEIAFPCPSRVILVSASIVGRMIGLILTSTGVQAICLMVELSNPGTTAPIR